MNCQNDPEATCGSLVNDSCVVITGIFPACLPGGQSCYRQSDFNNQAGTALCQIGSILFGTGSPFTGYLPVGVTSILGSINLSSLTGCTIGSLVITPTKTNVFSEFQNIYDILCANLPVSLNTPIVQGAAPGLNLKCLQDPCGTPIGTLGGVLQAIINNVCADEGLLFEALLTQTGTSAPAVTILADTIDPAQANITATRTGVGQYTLTANSTYLPAGFPAGRTTVYVGTPQNFTNQIIAYWLSTYVIVIQTATSGTNADGILNNTSIQIELF